MAAAPDLLVRRLRGRWQPVRRASGGAIHHLGRGVDVHAHHLAAGVVSAVGLVAGVVEAAPLEAELPVVADHPALLRRQTAYIG